MLPVKSNLTDKACGEPIGSNCVIWTGAPISGTCGISTLTDVITAINQNCCGATSSSPCYTGNWVDFSSSIPGSGAGPTYAYNITSFGIGASGNPSYKWTKEGNLALRGSFKLNVNTTVVKEYIDIVLGTVNKTLCAPANWNNNQGVVTFVDFFPQNNSVISTRAVVYLKYSTGEIVLNFTYGNIPLLPMTCEIDLGGVLFNLA
jgi:hypothetical protein